MPLPSFGRDTAVVSGYLAAGYEAYLRLFMPLDSAEGPGIARLGWQDGLLDPTPRPTETAFALDYAQFANDALIYHTPGATRITLRGKTPAPVLTVSYDDLPYLGLWTPADKQAPFLCIEPWAGVMDSASHDGNLENKLGIQRLAAHADWQRHYDIRIHDEAQS